MAERVQVQGIGGAVPGISPTIQRGGQYSVQVQQAGRNKLMDLADALSQVNPLLQNYVRLGSIQEAIGAEEAAALPESELFKTTRGSGGGRGVDPFAERAKERRFREEIEKRKVEYRKKLLAEGQQAFELDPTGVSERLKKDARKLAEIGELPDNANVIREVGALRAQAEVLAKRDYRAMLLDPTVLQTTEDPVVTALQKREEFLERIELQNPIVRDHALKFLMEAEDEFIDKAQDRLDARNIEIGKNSWLDLGRDSISLAIGGELDVNDEAVKTWLNHPAGIFKGSRKFAWDNLIKEDLKEGMTSGKYKPTQVTDFLDDLRSLDLGGGVKFADEETGNAISDFYGYVEEQRSSLEEKEFKRLKADFDSSTDTVVDLLEAARGQGETVPSDEALRIRASYLNDAPRGFKKEALATFDKMLKDMNAPSTDSSQLIVTKLEAFIDDGVELDVAARQVKELALDGPNNGGITAADRRRLLKKIEDSRDIDTLVYRTDSFYKLSSQYEEIITGFNREKVNKATYEVGYFTQLGATELAGGKLGKDSVYQRIQEKTGRDSAAKMFVNRRYSQFNLDLRKAFAESFKTFEKDPSTTPEQAAAKVQEQQQVIADEVFLNWERESIQEANALHGLAIPMPRRLQEVFGIERFREKKEN